MKTEEELAERKKKKLGTRFARSVGWVKGLPDYVTHGPEENWEEKKEEGLEEWKKGEKWEGQKVEWF